MALSRARKEELVAQYTDLVTDSAALVFTGYQGTSVPEMQDIRYRMQEAGATFMVVKNRPLRIALSTCHPDDEVPDFTGSRAVVFSGEDIGHTVTELKSHIARELRNNHPFHISGAWMSGQWLEAPDAEQLSELPSLAEVQAQLLATISAPARELVGMVDAVPNALYRVISAPPRDLAQVLRAHSEAP